MSEAQRLKMTGGHFIWIWADISSTAEFFQPNSVSSIDEKDQIGSVKTSYDEFGGRKSKYDKLNTPAERQNGQSGNKRPGQNGTRYKSLNTNSNRFHHIIGLRKPGDEDSIAISAILPERSFLKSEDNFSSDMTSGRIPLKDKRASKKIREAQPLNNDYSGSVETVKPNNLNIKNINSHEFNANYYDPYSTAREGENENAFEAESDENGDYDYEKSNPYQQSESLTPTTRRTLLDTKITEKAKADRKSLNRNNKPHANQALLPKLFDETDDSDSENYPETSNDLKAKRADNFPSTFNVSSHVFFHHFKDFPVGLLALRHIKMNVDRVFVRSAVRLFASTWNRVELDEEMRLSSGGQIDEQKNNSWSADDYDYDEANNNSRNKKKNKTNVNVNSRHNNARGSRKYKRDAMTQASISNSVNSSSKASNSNSKFIDNLTNKTYSQHVSDLNSHRSDDRNKSNNDNIKYDNLIKLNDTKSASQPKGSRELVRELNVGGAVEMKKRQSSWWDKNLRNQKDKTKIVSGTPHYKGGCFGVPSRVDIKRSELFARSVKVSLTFSVSSFLSIQRYLREAVGMALSGRNLAGASVEKSLISNFEILNLVPSSSKRSAKQHRDELRETPIISSTASELSESTKWRRVGLILGRKVHLDTIVW